MQIFISYKREDQGFAKTLRDNIKRWGHETWIDVDNIPPGVTQANRKGWDDAIHQGMKSSQVVIGVITPESLASENVLDEWGWALTNNRRLLLLWLRQVSNEDIPPRFIRIQRIDFRTNEAEGLSALCKALETPGIVIDNATERPSQPPAPPEKPRSDKKFETNRERMLKKVREYWIEGVLENALHDSELLELGIEIKVDAVLKHADYGDYALPDTAQIADIFKTLRRKLLILGDPGSGKTFTMLQLARDLITAAEQNPKEQIPVVFNLSSWTELRKPIALWLIEELQRKYQTPYKVARVWIENGDLLLLLDGLDEVKQEFQNECVEAINRFLREYSFIDVVVCSRIGDYKQLSARLNLQGAIVLQPLELEQIDAQLQKSNFTVLQEAIQRDRSLQDMAQSPLLLNAMIYAYRGSTKSDLVGPDSKEAWRDNLFERYIERRCRASTYDSYTLRATRHFLTWLARGSVIHAETVFLIESLQPDWVDPKLQLLNELVAKSLISIVFGILMGLLWGIAGSEVAHFSQPVFTIAFGFAATFNMWLALRRVINWKNSLISGVVYGSAFGIPAGLQNGVIWGLLTGVFVGFASIILFKFVLVYMFENPRDNNRDYSPRIRTVDLLTWSFSRAIYGFLTRGLILGGIVGAAIILVTLGLLEPQIATLFGIGLGLSVSLTVGALLGLSGNEIMTKTRPNEGIWQSIKNAARTGIMVGLTAGIPTGIVVTLGFNSTAGLHAGLAFGLFAGICGAAFFGGDAVIQHGVLRLMLWRKDYAPLNYARFLDYCADRVLLRKVGGGYIFIHRYLMEYFASLEQPADVKNP